MDLSKRLIFSVLYAFVVITPAYPQSTDPNTSDLSKELTRTPWGLEADLKAIGAGEKRVNIPIPVPQLPNSTPVVDPVVPGGDVMDNIVKNAFSVKSKPDPFASKYQDTKLSEKYEGKQVYYGDHKLDPKILDARYSLTKNSYDSVTLTFCLLAVAFGVVAIFYANKGKNGKSSDGGIMEKYPNLVKRLAGDKKSVVEEMKSGGVLISITGATTYVSITLERLGSKLRVDWFADYGLQGKYEKQWYFSNNTTEQEIAEGVENYMFVTTRKIVLGY